MASRDRFNVSLFGLYFEKIEIKLQRLLSLLHGSSLALGGSVLLA